MLSYISITDGTVFTGNKIEGYRTITITIIITLDNDDYESVCYAFTFEVLYYYDYYPFTHSNADIKRLSRDYVIHLIEWLENDSAVLDIQIDTRMNPD